MEIEQSKPASTVRTQVVNGGRGGRLQARKVDVREVRIVDTDLVLHMRDGKKVVVRNGAFRALSEPDFVLEFEDGVLHGQELLQSSGSVELGSISESTVGKYDAEASGENALSGDGARATESPRHADLSTAIRV